MLRPRGARPWLPPLVVVVAVVACFVPVLRNGFVAWDDDMNLTENPRFRGLSAGHLRWMFTTTLGGHYQPLSWLTLALDHAVWGMSPAGYHLTSLVLHVANAVLVYFLVRALLARTSRGASAAAAVAGALVFALHPLRVEPVAWASARRDVLSACFVLLAVLAYLRMAASGRPGWYVAALGCYALSLLAKASGMTLPALLLLLDWYPLRRRGLVRLLLEKVPFVALAAAVALNAVGTIRPIGATRTLAEHGVLARVAQAAWGLCFYPWKTLVPRHLSPLYLLELRLDPSAPRYVAALVVVAVITLGVVLARRRAPWALAAWAGYVLLVAPVLGVMQVGPQIAADRYTYLACLPAAVLAAAALVRWPGRTPRAAVASVLAVLGILTARQVAVWRDSRTLWEYVLRIDPGNYVAWTNHGSLRLAAGDRTGALADYESALRIHPGYPVGYYGRAIARQDAGDLAGAIGDFTVAVRLSPREPRYWNDRGWARQTAGDLRGAAADYAEALRVAPAGFEGRALIEQNLARMRALGVTVP